MSAPQIIRTIEQLNALDPVTVLEPYDDTPQYALHMIAEIRRDKRVGSNFTDGYLPAVVIATGEQVRAARKVLEEDA